MINFRDQVPSIYTSASRDFQYLGWLINIVLNSVKHNVDDIYNLPNISDDSKITELLAMTLGFKVKRNYDKKQLATLVSILPSILKYKGTIKAIEMAAEALVTTSGSLGDVIVKLPNGAEITIVLPKDLVDTTLFVDLLDYILPAGMTCRIVRTDVEEQKIQTNVKHDDTLRQLLTKDFDSNTGDGLASMYIFGKDQNGKDKKVTEFYANIKADGITVNAGLLNNTIIPVLSGETVEADNSIALYTTQGKNEDGTLITQPLLVKDGKQLKAKKSKQEL